jgi:outer membrane protein insertion porin family
MLALLLPLLLAGSTPVQSVESVETRGLQLLSEETLLYYLGLQPGQPLDREALDRNVKELWQRGLVDDVEIESFPTPAGLRLRITIAERPILRSIDYEGLKRVAKTDLQDRMTGQRIRARESEPLSLGELQRIKTLVEEMYAEKGYRFASARYAVEEVGPNEKKVMFTVDEGDRVRISDVRFDGNTVHPDLRLRLAMKNTRESGPITRLMKKDVYDPARLQEDLDRLRDLYRAAGYKNVIIGDPQIEVNPERRLSITVPIEEGERWKLGQVTIEGNEIHSDQLLLRAFPQKPGDWLRFQEIEDGVKKIADAYHDSGYIFAGAEPELVEREDHVADLVVHVQEGDPFKVGRIEFEGNDRTNDKVLRRELRLYEGGLMSLTALRNSVLKMNQLGYFKLNEEDPVAVEPNAETKTVDLLFQGDESDRLELQFGGGWSEQEGLFGQFGVNTKNFLGRGEQLGASYQAGDRGDSLQLSYGVPWFLDRPQSLGFSVYDQAYEFGTVKDLDYYKRDSQGAVLTYGRNFRLFQSASLGYQRSRYDDLYNVLLEDDALATAQAFIDNSSLRPLYVFDTRDNPFEPNRGRKLSLSMEYAGGFLGGDNQFIRPEIAFSLFQPASRDPIHSVLALNVKGGWIDPFSGHRLPTLERYFLGGETSVRGHKPHSIYLRDAEGNPRRDENNALLGGDSFVQFNLEYHLLPGGPFRLLLFADAGNVFGEGQPFDLSNLRTTAGLELRVLLPVFGAPLRFIYARNLDPRPQDDFEEFKFSIGTSF